MNKEELKSLVKKYFHLEDKQPEQPLTEETQKFSEAKLQDGTVVTNMTDAPFEVGQTLHVITESGEHVIAPTGEHLLEDGTLVVINEEGTITGIKQPDATGEGSLEASKEEMTEETTADNAEEKTELSEEEATEEATPEAEEKTEMADHETTDEETSMEEHDIREEIVSAIADVVQPEIEAMKQKMAEIEEAMKEHYSKTPASEPTVESRFSKIQEIKNGEKKGLNTFDAKAAQREMILRNLKSRINK